MSEHIIILTTVGSHDEAIVIADALLERRLVACVNITSPVTSVYRWKGEVHHDEERLMLLKTLRSSFERVRAALSELHSYELPEVVAVPIEAGDDNYLNWVTAACSP